MTKPVQIQRYEHVGYQDDCEHQESDTGTWVLHADHQAALLQVRLELGKLAVKLRVVPDDFSPETQGACARVADELTKLSSTLGEPLDLEAHCIRLEAALKNTVQGIKHLRYCGVCGEDSLEVCDEGLLALAALKEANSALAATLGNQGK